MIKFNTLTAKLPIEPFRAWLASTVQNLRDFIEGLSRKGQIEKELKYYASLGPEAREDVRIKLKIAELYFRKKDAGAAVGIYREVAQKHSEEGFTMKAIDAFQNVLRLCPTDMSTNERLGELYEKAGMHEEALQQYEIAFYAYRRASNTDKALAMCEEMTKLAPTPLYRRKLAEAYQAIGKTEEALAEFEWIAKEYQKEKNDDALLEIYKLIYPRRRDDKNLVRDMALLYVRKRTPQEAIRLLERSHLADDSDCKDIYEQAKLFAQQLAAGNQA